MVLHLTDNVLLANLLLVLTEIDIAVQEPDETWNWDILFTDVSSELMTEWFPETEEEKKNAVKERPYTAFNRFPV
jgi:hypothetical protein